MQNLRRLVPDERKGMMPGVIVQERERPSVLNERAKNSPSEISVSRKLEALTCLAHALLREIEALKETSDRATTMNITNAVQRFEAELIRSALAQTGGKLRRAAHLLGMKVTTLHSKIKRYNIS